MAGNHPSELSPRQRMINMMYLVLTALLALNVSKEVLESFFEVNQGIERTTTNFFSKNLETYADFDNAATNNPEKYQEVRDKAYDIKRMSDELVILLQEMKYDLVFEADKKKVYLGEDWEIYDDKGNLREEALIEKTFQELSENQKKKKIGYLYNKSNRTVSGDLFWEAGAKGNRANNLKDKITTFSNFLIEASGDNKQLITSIKSSTDVSPRKKKGKKNQTIDWGEYYFNDMPAVGALTLLSKIQSDARNAEADVIDFLKKDIDKKSLKFSDAEGIAIAKSNFVVQGENFNADVFITAKNRDQNPEIYIGEYDIIDSATNQYKMRGVEDEDYQTIEVSGGVGKYEVRTGSVGLKEWGGLIAMKTETGTKFYPFKGEYLVAPKMAVVAPTNMNVLYLAIDNPISVSVPGYPASDVIPTTINGKISVINKAKGEYIIHPTKLEPKNKPIVSLYVQKDGKRKLMGSAEFKVKDVPDPVPVVAKKRGGVISRADLKGAQQIIAQMKDFPFDRDALSFRIKSYDIVAYYNNKRQNIPTVKGQRFNDAVIKAINATASGTEITFSNIIAQRRGVKNSKKRDLGSITFKIK